MKSISVKTCTWPDFSAGSGVAWLVRYLPTTALIFRCCINPNQCLCNCVIRVFGQRGATDSMDHKDVVVFTLATQRNHRGKLDVMKRVVSPIIRSTGSEVISPTWVKVAAPQKSTWIDSLCKLHHSYTWDCLCGLRRWLYLGSCIVKRRCGIFVGRRWW